MGWKRQRARVRVGSSLEKKKKDGRTVLTRRSLDRKSSLKWAREVYIYVHGFMKRTLDCGVKVLVEVRSSRFIQR